MLPYADALRVGAPTCKRPPDRILVVDDEAGVRDLMTRWLRAGGYEVICAATADEALVLVAAEQPAVALCDVRMPGRDGLWLANRIRNEYPDTAVIMATGVHAVGAAVASLRQGVVDYLTKPFGRDRLRDAVVRALEWHRTARDVRSWRDTLEGEADAGRSRLAQIIGAARVTSDAGVEALLDALAAGAPGFAVHARRTATLAGNIAQALGLAAPEVLTIRRGALLHDLGKLALPAAILQKPAPLTPDEQALVRRHPFVGAQLIAAEPFLAEAAVIVRTAQERPDGLGYPGGFAAPALPLGAQIVAAADAFDTMRHPRIFRGALSLSDALLELDRGSGTQFNPGVVQVLKQLVSS